MGTKGITKVFFATDVHGSERTFRKFVNAGKVYKADVLILGGDITGKTVVPIVKHEDGTSSCQFLGSPLTLKTAQEVEDIARRISDIGYYPYQTSIKEMEELQADKSKADEVYVTLMTERLLGWMRLAEENLKGTNIRCFITGGNDDPFLIEKILDSSELIVNPENKVVRLNDLYEMVSCAYSNPTPWKTPRELSEDELGKKIEGLSGQVESMQDCIFNLHVPPIDSGLDTCPKLDTSKDPPQPIVEGGQQVLMGAGSSSVRQAIEKYQPLVGLHGHIHESRAVMKIGRTCCINPGSEYGEGILRGAIVNLKEKKLLSYQLTSG